MSQRLTHATVDENLFYKGVDKSVVHGARLHQTHNAAEGDHTPTQPAANDPGHPPYPFESGNSLLALTRKHNVCSILSWRYLIVIGRIAHHCANRA
jgi:hypothetical protein